MSLLLALAIFFVLWWIVLMAVLPVGVKTIAEAGEKTIPGSVSSAPHKPMLWRKAAWTSIISAIIVTIFYALSHSGFSVDDIPFLQL